MDPIDDRDTPLVLEVEGDLTCYSDTLRTDGRYGADIVLLSLFGARNAVRAAWAKLAKDSRKKYTEGIKVGERHVRRGEETGYMTTSAPLGRGLVHIVTFDLMLGRGAPDRGFYFHAAPSTSSNAPGTWYERLFRCCEIPLRVEWAPVLWDLGLAAGAIVELKGHGRCVWKVETGTKAWAPIVKEGILSRQLASSTSVRCLGAAGAVL